MTSAGQTHTLGSHDRRTPVLGPEQSFESITDHVSGLVLDRPTSRAWLLGLSLAVALTFVLTLAVAYLLVAGVGIWGVNIPVAWGFAILNFVWWIGIGHAGTLISAILLLMRQPWRNAVSRFAEAMTLFALACAGLFPLLHLGRPWLFYWMLPYDNTMDAWPQFRSALVWDLFAILTYSIVSLLFWYIGMVPDLASLRDRARRPWVGRIYAALALGWRGEASHWHRFERAYVLLAALATPLVISVHSIVSYDFAVTVLPGWHSTIFPPYFVAGAMHSGLAMVLVLAVPLRRFYRLESLITEHHFQVLAKVLLTTGLVVGYGYVMEFFGQWYSDSEVEWHIAQLRMTGHYAWMFWTLVVCNVVIPQACWLQRVRSSRMALWWIGAIVLVGMWLERYLIVISTLHQDFLPSAWGPYQPTFWDWALFIGTLGLFFLLFLLFVRLLPVVSIFEVRQLVAKRDYPAAGVEQGGRR